ncbi:hypothetical protein PENSPDRAFT_80983 [Peniophora sp. CONT]|nr:hypothetical protein PENSPDRAFT_80983 [Peniophora sp. CONT]
MMMLDSLPTDVLCDIFIALKGVHPARELAQPLQAGEFEADGNLHLARLGWLVITFVNQRWRSIALELAILWSRLPTHLGSEWLQIFVSRSKGTALTYIDMGRRAKGTAVQAREDIFTSVIPANKYRMRKIRLFFLPRHLPIEAALSHPAPLLEEFAISGDLRIDTLVFAGQGPRLRALILSPWCSYSEQPGSLLSLDTQPTVLSRLTFLRLSCNIDVPPVHTVIGILRHTTQLEILCITDMVSSREAPPFEPTISCSDALPAHLPALKGCSLYGRIDYITHLVTHLRLPLSVEMSIDCDCSPLAYHPDSSVL